MQKYIETTRAVWNAIFNKNPDIKIDTCEFDQDTIVIEKSLYIRKIPNCIKRNSILGPIYLDGYVVEVGCTTSNYPHSPDDYDYVQIGDPTSSYYDALEILITSQVKEHYRAVLEHIYFSEEFSPERSRLLDVLVEEAQKEDMGY